MRYIGRKKMDEIEFTVYNIHEYLEQVYACSSFEFYGAIDIFYSIEVIACK